MVFCLLKAVALIFIFGNTQNTVDGAATPIIFGLQPDKYENDGKNIILKYQNEYDFEVFGSELDKILEISFVLEDGEAGAPCNHMDRQTSSNTYNTTKTKYNFKLGKPKFYGPMYLCIRVNNATDDNFWIHPRIESKNSISVLIEKEIIPFWLKICFIILFFVLSGTFSGLNLGLMALGKTELKIIEAAGSSQEKRYARKIRPVREKGNLLLCTLLVGNVVVNTTLTIFLDGLIGSGLAAICISSAGITLFGEIVPQAICSRHGLAIGAGTIWLTKLFIVLCFPVAFPISFILNKLLGEEIGAVYNRDKLSVLIREQEVAGTVVKDEMNIITGALTMTTKTVEDVMTPLGDAFMLPYDGYFDFETMNEIFSNGYTRIPVYQDNKADIKSVINVKDLAFINVEDNVSVRTICEFYNRSVLIVPNTYNLELMLKEFRQGKAHMAFVERTVTDCAADPYRETIGIVTLEDVIEEIIQAEIVDETDAYMDNVHRQLRQLRKRDFRIFNSKNTRRTFVITPQLKIAAMRFIVSNTDAFSDAKVSLTLLQSMLNSHITERVYYKHGQTDQNLLYTAGKECNYYILILQGKVKVTVKAAENISFEGGPFSQFGEIIFTKMDPILPELLAQESVEEVSKRMSDVCRFTPDYSVQVLTSSVEFLRIYPQHYFLLRKMHQNYELLAPSIPIDEIEAPYSVYGLVNMPSIPKPSDDVEYEGNISDSFPSNGFQMAYDMLEGALKHAAITSFHSRLNFTNREIEIEMSTNRTSSNESSRVRYINEKRLAKFRSRASDAGRRDVEAVVPLRSSSISPKQESNKDSQSMPDVNFKSDL